MRFHKLLLLLALYWLKFSARSNWCRSCCCCCCFATEKWWHFFISKIHLNVDSCQMKKFIATVPELRAKRYVIVGSLAPQTFYYFSLVYDFDKLEWENPRVWICDCLSFCWARLCKITQNYSWIVIMRENLLLKKQTNYKNAHTHRHSHTRKYVDGAATMCGRNEDGLTTGKCVDKCQTTSGNTV